MIRVAASVLNFNDTAATLDCVGSLLETEQGCDIPCSLTIHVADNASTPAQREHLRNALADKPTMHLLELDSNLGFAGGHNRNLATIFDTSSPDFVWLLNNDCVVRPDALEALLHCARACPDVGIWGATLLEADGETIQCAGGCSYSTWVSTFHPHGRGHSSETRERLREQTLDYVAGASMFMPVATLETGLSPPRLHPRATHAPNGMWLNETFFLYYEELDLAQRLDASLSLKWCRDAMIVHASQKPGRQARRRSEYHANLSALQFTWLYCPGKLAVMAPLRFALKWAVHFVTLKWDRWAPLAKAYSDFVSWRRTGRLPPEEPIEARDSA